MQLIRKYYLEFKKNAGNRAFCIANQDISYGEFLTYIWGTRRLLESNIVGKNNPIGVICFDCIETYAAIFSAWFSGNSFVPINPKHPLERNMALIRNTGVRMVCSAKKNVETIIDTEQIRLLINSGVKSTDDHAPVETTNDQLMYVLTTSGSTGVPKHVPIHLENVEAYCSGFLQLFPELTGDACFLQTYDLTSDAAFTGYLLPLLVGGCVYTLPDDQFKFLTIARLISDKRVNWVKLTPSVLSYLRSYISKLDLKHIQHFIFGGEALPLSLVNEWYPSFPQAQIANLYGPTETTISSTAFKFNNIAAARVMNGIVSIGKPFPEVDCVVIDEKQHVLGAGVKGELCIGGKQTMSGYLNGVQDSFVYLNVVGGRKKYYRTGDLVQRDEDGYYYFIGRVDDQVKINGYRINLIEVENAVRNLVPGCNVAVVAREKLPGLKRLYVFLEGFTGELEQIKQKLMQQLPGQMVPDEVFSVSRFPFTTSGKIDKKKLSNDYFFNTNGCIL